MQGLNARLSTSPDRSLSLSQTSPYSKFMCLQYNSIENTIGKGEIARAISPFPTVFITLLENFLPCSLNLNCRLQTIAVKSPFTLDSFIRVLPMKEAIDTLVFYHSPRPIVFFLPTKFLWSSITWKCIVL